MSMIRAWLVLTNLTISASWLRSFVTIASTGCLMAMLPSVDEAPVAAMCVNETTAAVTFALCSSFLELFNCLMGFTKSPPLAVLLFSCTRMGVERLVAPMIPCTSWQHILTIATWSIGDTIRFGCFAIDGMLPNGSHFVKSVRFTVGPILFPIGALAGEMMMVILAGQLNSKPILYGAAALWPVFFYPMMKQLLRQRKKHFDKISGKAKTKEIKRV